MQDYTENRRFERTVFSGRDSISGLFALENAPGDPLRADIMDLSLGGMGILFPADMSDRIQQGDTIILCEIQDIASLAFMKNISVKIRWAARQSSGQFAAGCEYSELPEEVKEKLQKAMGAWKIKLL